MEFRGTGAKATLLLIVLLAPVFFFINQELDYSYEGSVIEHADNYEEKIDFEARADEGNLPRRAALASLGVVSLLGWLFIDRRRRIALNEPLVWALLAFAVWSSASVLWSIDASLTIRKLIGFGIFCFGALVLAGCFPMDIVPVCVLWLAGLYAAVGLAVEVLSGAFQPWVAGYRFAGTMHPNMQGANCALMLFAAVALAGCPERRRGMYQAIAALAFVLLVLTGSRTSFISALVALAVLFFLQSSDRRKAVVYLLGVLCLFGILFLFIGEDLITRVKEGIFLGRDTEEVATFTGRTSIWDKSLHYIGMRPLEGYGFNSFWVPLHIRDFTQALGWNIPDVHSAYIDVVLNIGLVGLACFLAILLIGIRRAFAVYFSARDMEHRFLLMTMIFFPSSGLMESGLVEMSSFSSFVFAWTLFSLALLSPGSGVREAESA